MRIFLVATLLICSAGGAWAAEEVEKLCGPPPSVSDEAWRTEVEGEAHVISRLLGGAEGKAKVEKWKSDIFSKYPNADRVRVNAFMQYNVCAEIARSEDMNSQQKIDMLIRVYEVLQTSGVNKTTSSGSIGDVGERARVFQNNFSISIFESETGLSRSQKELLSEIASVVSEAVGAASTENIDQSTTDHLAQALSNIVKEIPLNDYMIDLDTFEILQNHTFFLKGTNTTLSVDYVGDDSATTRLNGRRKAMRVGDVVEMPDGANACRLVLHEVRKDEKKATFSYLCQQ